MIVLFGSLFQRFLSVVSKVRFWYSMKISLLIIRLSFGWPQTISNRVVINCVSNKELRIRWISVRDFRFSRWQHSHSLQRQGKGRKVHNLSSIPYFLLKIKDYIKNNCHEELSFSVQKLELIHWYFINLLYLLAHHLPDRHNSFKGLRISLNPMLKVIINLTVL